MNIILNVKKWLTRFVFNASDTWKNVIQSPQANFDFNWIQDKVERTKWNMLSLRDILRVFWSRLGCLIQIKFNLTTWRRTEQKSEIRLQTVDTVNYIDKNGGDNFPGGSSNNLPMFAWSFKNNQDFFEQINRAQKFQNSCILRLAWWLRHLCLECM